MVSLIDELEGRQWVTRQKSKLDRRRHQLVVAPAGEAALLRLLAVLEDVESQGLKALSGAELDVLTVALDKLYTAYRSLAADAAGKSADDTAEP
ncbi:MAG TPA: MarR family winged helix-turn-helix transcriptional regulator, partial [Woeseiaceae bacterium]|nr:MarR family winged helix-turn-helix transcriptional regulator [Woeseiaceae bacterium]